MREVVHKVYQFDELSESAKERARSWFRDNIENSDYAESVIEDAVRMGDIIGISIDTHGVKLMNGNTRQDPSVWWSGFSYQGDGASFDGRYAYRAGSVKALAAEAPPTYNGKENKSNAAINQIARDLADLQKRHFYKLTARVKAGSRGHYLTIDVFNGG